MSRIVYVNGRYEPYEKAHLHIEDRGLQFADSVYEAMGIHNGRLILLQPHIDRLWRSLEHISLPAPFSQKVLTLLMQEVVARNRINNGLLYIQITRGAAPRKHAFPRPAPSPGLIITAQSMPPPSLPKEAARIMCLPDTRWSGVAVKTTNLLPNVLAKQAALDSAADEAWFVNDDGCITEGSSTNAYIVTFGGVLITHPCNGRILPGVIRAAILKAARALGIKVEERPFTVEEAHSAREVFYSSSSNPVIPVGSIDGRKINNGQASELAPCLFDQLYENYYDKKNIRSDY